jgi:hypothetical protein
MGFLEQAAAALFKHNRVAATEEAWRAINRSRALLRLIRGDIGDRIYLFEDSQLRKAVRLIAPSRDGAAAIPFLEGLVEHFSDRLVGPDAGRPETPAPSDAQVARVSELVTAARVRYAAFDVGAFRDSFSTVAPGLGLTYAKGQLRMGEALRHSSDLSFRKWSTQVRYLRDQSTMLDPDWAALGTSAGLRRLAVSLEEARLLAPLAAVDEHGGGRDEEDRELLRLVILGRCHDLYRQALPIGEGLYGVDPVEFTASFGAHWESWRSS